MTQTTKPQPKWNFPVELQSLRTMKSIAAPRFKAVVRTDTKKVLGIVGLDYKIITNKDFLEQIESSLPVSIASRKIEICNEGAMMFVNYESPKIKPIDVKKGDTVQFGIRLFNSYNKRLAVGMQLLAYRLVCMNGMTVPKGVSTLHVRHTARADIPNAYKEFQKKIAQFTKSSIIWQNWTKQKPTASTIDSFLTQNVSKSAKKLILANFEDSKDSSLWGLFNSVTWFRTHVLKTLSLDSEAATNSKDNLPQNRIKDLAHKQFGFDRRVVEKFYSQKWN